MVLPTEFSAPKSAVEKPPTKIEGIIIDPQKITLTEILNNKKLRPLKTAMELTASVERADKGVDPKRLTEYMKNNYPYLDEVEINKMLETAGQVSTHWKVQESTSVKK